MSVKTLSGTGAVPWAACGGIPESCLVESVLADADASNGQTYKGTLVAVTSYHALQNIGAGRFILHDLTLTATRFPQPGEEVTVSYAYEHGKIVLQPPEPELAKASLAVPQEEEGATQRLLRLAMEEGASLADMLPESIAKKLKSPSELEVSDSPEEPDDSGCGIIR
jgi:hypothetical protein